MFSPALYRVKGSKKINSLMSKESWPETWSQIPTWAFSNLVRPFPVSKCCHDWEQRSWHLVSPSRNTRRTQEENDVVPANFPKRELGPLSCAFFCRICTCCKDICIIRLGELWDYPVKVNLLELRKNIFHVKMCDRQQENCDSVYVSRDQGESFSCIFCKPLFHIWIFSN